jgi:Tfp pilus assembly protein PilO
VTLSVYRKTLLTGVLAIAVLVAAAWFGLLAPRLGQASDINTEADGIRQQNTALTASIDNLEAKRTDLPAQRDYEAALARRVPAGTAQAELFTDLRDAASRAGIPEQGIESLTPSLPEPVGVTSSDEAVNGSGLARMEVSMTVNAPFGSAVNFIRELENMPRSYLIDGVDMSADSDGGDYRISVTGAMFVMQAPIDPDAVTEGQPTN